MNLFPDMHAGAGFCTANPSLWGRNSKFIRYLAWLQSAPCLPEVSGNVPLFPCVLPYPEAVPAKGNTVLKYAGAQHWAKAFLNVFVAWSNYVVLGCPDCEGEVSEPRAGYRSIEDAKSFCDELLGEVEMFYSPSLFSGSCDGKRAEVEALLERLECTASGYHGFLREAGDCEVSTALPVVASRVAVPKEAGQVDPLEWLPSDRREVVANLAGQQLPEHLWEDGVVACHRVAADEEEALARKLWERNMVVFIPESELPRNREGRLLCGGFFSVRKNLEEDRLIYDRRPENSTMRRLGWAQLPSGACFSHMLLDADEYLRGSGDDLRNYYYTLRLPTNWTRHNAVGRRVSASLLREAGLDPQQPHRMCMRVLGMGDINGCDIAQATHEEILKSEGVLSSESTLVYGKPTPRGPLWEGVYLDDLLIVYKKKLPYQIPLDGSFSPPDAQAGDVDMRKIGAAESAYEKAGLERAQHKSFRAETHFKAWGCEIDGILGTAGAPLQVRQQVWVLIRKLVKLGFASKRVLQRIIGYSSYLFQYRRELFCLQHHIHKFIAGLRENVWVKLPPYILDELRSISLHLPFAIWKMRRSLCSEVLASDATPTSGGAVIAEAPAEVVRELWQCGELKGEAIRLDRENDLLWEALHPKEPSKIASAIAEVLPWRVCASYTFRQTSHINLQEARALRREIRRISADPRRRRQVIVCLNDSRVVVGAVAKGRSSSYKLNGLLRAWLPFLIAGDLALCMVWVETESNRADAPSRGHPLPIPRAPTRWMRELGLQGGLNEQPGWEIFAGAGTLTKCLLEVGCPMWAPAAIVNAEGLDVFSPEIVKRIFEGKVSWVWLSPPWSSFSPLRNLDSGGPLRPRQLPEGRRGDRAALYGNRLWDRAVQLARLCLSCGVPFILEHPRRSRAWEMPSTYPLTKAPGVKQHIVHMCAYGDVLDGIAENHKRETRLLGTVPWLESAIRVCSRAHRHPASCRKDGAQRARDYPLGFCQAIACARLAFQ